MAGGSENGGEGRKAPIARTQLEELIDRGMTIREIAEEVDRCTLTVQRWLGRYGLKTEASRRAGAQRTARADGLRVILQSCKRHGESEFVLDRSGHYRCRRCRAESVTRRRRRVKELLVSEAGGRCVICGYDRYVGALEFHHVNPDDKRLGLAMGGIALSIDKLRSETAKCVLLCSNCHAEVEGGVARLPIE